MSTTRRAPSMVRGRPSREDPQPLQYSGWRCSTRSGSATILRVLPLRPGGPPGFLPVAFRRLRSFLGRFSSLEGGDRTVAAVLGVPEFGETLAKGLVLPAKRFVLL